MLTSSKNNKNRGFNERPLTLPTNLKRALSNLAFSKNGEFSALSQYIYNSAILKKHSEMQISEAFERISHDALTNAQKLCSILSQSLTPPKFSYYPPNSNMSMPWNSNLLDYTKTTPKEMLLMAIRHEDSIIKSYMRIKEEVKEQSIQNVLDKIILSHHAHLDTFSILLSRLS